MLANEKSHLRQKMRQLRRECGANLRWIAAHKLTAIALSTQWFACGQRIAAYWACGTELSLKPLINVLLARGVQVYLPHTQANGTMRFLRHQLESELVLGAHGIAAPKSSDDITGAAHTDIAITDADIVLVPLLAFDAHGNRLGQGGGYYDRLFQRRVGAQQPRKIGIAFDFQCVAHLPVEAFDQKLDAVITEFGVRNF